MSPTVTAVSRSLLIVGFVKLSRGDRDIYDDDDYDNKQGAGRARWTMCTYSERPSNGWNVCSHAFRANTTVNKLYKYIGMSSTGFAVAHVAQVDVNWTGENLSAGSYSRRSYTVVLTARETT